MQAEPAERAARPRRGRPARRNLVREAMLRAAQAMMAEGLDPTLPEVADRAGVARATAYRHFASGEALLNEAALDRIAEAVARVDPAAQAASAEAAVEALVRRVFAMLAANEGAFRTLLRLTLERRGGGRGGRRLGWARAALAPFAGEFPPGALDRLVPALALALGIEAWVALRDVAGLDRAAAEEAAVWSARALVAAARAGA